MQSVIKIMDREVSLFQIILKHFNIFIVLFFRFTGFHPDHLPISDWSWLFHPTEVAKFFQQRNKGALRDSDEFHQKTNTVADSTAKENNIYKGTC